MTPLIRSLTVVASLALIINVAGAQAYDRQGKPCAGLQGHVRKTCLDEAVRTGQAEAAAANAHLERLNRQMTAACNAAALLDQAAQAATVAGDVSRAKPLSLGGRTWTSVRAITTELTRERKNCADARRALDMARK